VPVCLILFSFNPSATYPLVVLANRDEFHDRPSAPAAPWEDYPDIVAGRDLEKGGTWMGVSRQGRFAAVTNYRSPRDMKAGGRSRGELTVDFLAGQDDVSTYMTRVAAHSSAYAGFNLLIYDGQTMGYLSNRLRPGSRFVSEGLHGLSNAFLDSDWPKVSQGTKELSSLMEAGEPEPSWLSIMMDTEQASDDLLPDTGIGLEKERVLSPRFIHLPNYGTRCTSYVCIRRDGRIEFEERTHASGGGAPATMRYVFDVSGGAGT